MGMTEEWAEGSGRWDGDLESIRVLGRHLASLSPTPTNGPYGGVIAGVVSIGLLTGDSRRLWR